MGDLIDGLFLPAPMGDDGCSLRLSLADVLSHNAMVADARAAVSRLAADNARLTKQVATVAARGEHFADLCGGYIDERGRLAAEVERLTGEVAVLRMAASEGLDFRPLGDNHHNAAKCPYCSPWSAIAEAERERDALRGKLADVEKDRQRLDADVKAAHGMRAELEMTKAQLERAERRDSIRRAALEMILAGIDPLGTQQENWIASYAQPAIGEEPTFPGMGGSTKETP